MLNQLTQHVGRNLVAYIALFVALSGSAFAAAQAVAPNSVGTPQLKNNAVTTLKVKNGTLLKADFKAGQLQPGPAGPAGPQGPAGAAGPAAAKAWAVVSGSTGSLVRGNGVADSDKLGVGQYRVKFNESIATCSWFATPNSTNNGFNTGQASANRDSGNDAWLRVGTFTAGGAFGDAPQVSVAVYC